ncbi:hypothetical protein GQ42DRAFT_124437 [Ramicandelaber brevisporus]|nr:hypothetical protein GQ42DRAFT_124437 [Ramicandelaber brevisporus]
MVRTKNRYLLAEIILEGYAHPALPATSERLQQQQQQQPPQVAGLTTAVLAAAIRRSLKTNFGDYGSALLAAAVSVKYLGSSTLLAVIRFPRMHYQLGWSAITLLTHIGEEDGLQLPAKMQCMIRVVHVSGTIKQCQNAATEYNTELLRDSGFSSLTG